MKLAAGLIVGMVLGLCLSAQAHDRIDPLVHMLEAKLSGLAHVEIHPGVTLTLMDCQCTIRYEGVKIRGRHYDVEFEKLD